jgi:hypothetical protein
MPVRIKAVHFDKDTAERIRRELNFISSSDFLKTLDITDIVAEVKQYLLDSLPRATRPGRPSTVTYQKDKSHLAEYIKGWRVSREYTGNRLFLNVRHKSDDSDQWFGLFEFGSKASRWIAQRTFRFFSDKEGWTTIVKGRSVAHAATTGRYVGDRAKKWLEGILVAKLQERVIQTVNRRLARA